MNTLSIQNLGHITAVAKTASAMAQRTTLKEARAYIEFQTGREWVECAAVFEQVLKVRTKKEFLSLLCAIEESHEEAQRLAVIARKARRLVEVAAGKGIALTEEAARGYMAKTGSVATGLAMAIDDIEPAHVEALKENNRFDWLANRWGLFWEACDNSTRRTMIEDAHAEALEEERQYASAWVALSSYPAFTYLDNDIRRRRALDAAHAEALELDSLIVRQAITDNKNELNKPFEQRNRQYLWENVWSFAYRMERIRAAHTEALKMNQSDSGRKGKAWRTAEAGFQAAAESGNCYEIKSELLAALVGELKSQGTTFEIRSYEYIVVMCAGLRGDFEPERGVIIANTNDRQKTDVVSKRIRKLVANCQVKQSMFEKVKSMARRVVSGESLPFSFSGVSGHIEREKNNFVVFWCGQRRYLATLSDAMREHVITVISRAGWLSGGGIVRP